MRGFRCTGISTHSRAFARIAARLSICVVVFGSADCLGVENEEIKTVMCDAYRTSFWGRLQFIQSALTINRDHLKPALRADMKKDINELFDIARKAAVDHCNITDPE